MVTSLWDMAIALLGTATVLAQTVTPGPLPQEPRPIPSGSRLFTQTSNTLNSSPFVTLPQAAPQPAGEAEVEAFIYNNTNCVYAGSPLYYRLYVGNTGTAAARSLNIQFQYPAGTTYQSAEPNPDQQDLNRRLLEWSEDALAPKGGYAQYTVTVRADAAGQKQSILIVTYLNARGEVKQTVTTHTLPGDCSEPNAPTKERSSKLPAIICDPAETSCVPFLPTLGIRFGKNTSKPFILNQPKPILGARFNEAIANIVPGECRVAADDIIETPEYHDALNRLYDPAAFYMQPLYNSGLDFKQLVHENNLLGITFTTGAQQRLQELHTKMWREHLDIVKKVDNGDISGSRARDQLTAQLERWQDQLRSNQQQLSGQYAQMQGRRRGKFDPVAEAAVENAKASMGRACNSNSDAGLASLLPKVRAAYVQLLNIRSGEFARTQNQLSGLAPVAALWQQQLYPALIAYDQGNQQPLKDYLSAQGRFSDSLFEQMFDAYRQHQATDFSVLEVFRLTEFDVALDTPKTAATKCEKDKVFKAPVDTTFCESGNPPPQVLGREATQARQQNPNARPADPLSQGTTSINSDLVKGLACSPDPNERGAPWWADDCSCKCDDLVPTLDANGNVVLQSCQEVKKIVRHDRAVNSPEECLQQKAHHPELYF